MRELGIVPVFPPREDLFVGDVYAYELDPEGKEADRLLQTKWKRLRDSKDKRKRMALGLSPRLYRLDLNDEAFVQYQNTLSAPATPDDYNSILGNRALAAAQQGVARAQAALKKVQDQIKGKREALAAAETALRDSNRAKTDADAALAEKQALLKRAEASEPNTAAERDAVERGQGEVRGAEEAVRAADAALATEQAELSRLPQDDPARPQAQRDVYAAEDTKRTAGAALARERAELKNAVADLAAKRAARPDVASTRASVATAEDTKRAAAADVIVKTRARDDAKRTLDETTASTKDDLKKKMQAVKNAEGVRDAIAKAGERQLYAQPRDGERDVYTARELAHPGLPDDLANTRVNRLRLVGFPEFSTATFSQGDLSALIPIEAFSLGLNASSAKATRVTVKVPAAESYGVPVASLIQTGDADALENHRDQLRDLERQVSKLDQAIRELEKVIAELEATPRTSRRVAPDVNADLLPAAARLAQPQLITIDRDRAYIEEEPDPQCDLENARAELEARLQDRRKLADQAEQIWLKLGLIDGALVFESGEDFILHPDVLRALKLQFFGKKNAYIRVPTEVFYARALDVSVFYASSYGVRAKLTLLEQAQALQATEDGAAVPLRSGTSTGAQLLQGVETSLGQTMSVPGGSVQLVGFNERSVGLRRVFDRPVAIGFRGLTLGVNLESGKVSSSDPSGGRTPTDKVNHGAARGDTTFDPREEPHDASALDPPAAEPGEAGSDG